MDNNAALPRVTMMLPPDAAERPNVAAITKLEAARPTSLIVTIFVSDIIGAITGTSDNAVVVVVRDVVVFVVVLDDGC